MLTPNNSNLKSKIPARTKYVAKKHHTSYAKIIYYTQKLSPI